MIVRRLLLLPVLMLAAVSFSCRSESPVQPDGISCFLGPLDLPKGTEQSPAPICFLGKSGCPNTPPFGARTLVGLATCSDDPSSTTKCTPVVTACPSINPDGATTSRRFLIARPGDACSAVVDILVQGSSNAGGAGLEWRVQDYELSGSLCVAKGGVRVGITAMPGTCCATQLEIPVPERNRTFRLIARSDWLPPE